MKSFNDIFTMDGFKKFMPGVPDVDIWFAEFASALPSFGITAPDVLAQFMATVAHETNGLTMLDEKSAWAAKGLGSPSLWKTLVRVFPKKFTTVGYAESVCKRGIDSVFEVAYGGRKSLGNTTSGFGAKYTGRGCFHLTGYANYLTYTQYAQKHTGDKAVDYVVNPDLVLTPYHAVLTACLYWVKSGCQQLAVIPGNFEKVCIRVNGGTNDLDVRIKLYNKARVIFK